MKSQARGWDPIAALATPPGVGALAVIRASGSGIFPMLSPLFPGDPSLEHWNPWQLYLRRFVDEGEMVDQVMAVRYLAPRSYTGEDMVEIFTHGGWMVPHRVLQALLRRGVREARPGEFTFRAVMHGKMDLLQAQGVHEVVTAGSVEGARVAWRRLSGEDSSEYREVRDRLLKLLMEIEAQIDFPEDVPPLSPSAILQRLKDALNVVHQVIEEGERGRRWIESHQVVLVGPPNAGKSTLFNAMIGDERAIVTDIPGTTRDVLRERVLFRGIPLTFLDTAGLRSHTDPVEAEGIRRIREHLSDVHLVLFVASEDTPYEEAWRVFLTWGYRGPVVWIWNKVDRGIPSGWRPPDLPVVALSARTGQGLDALADVLYQTLQGQAPPHRALSQRDLRLFESVRVRLEEARDRLGRGEPLEVVALVIREGVREVELLLGIEDLTEAVLDEIFSNFCIGK